MINVQPVGSPGAYRSAGLHLLRQAADQLRAVPAAGLSREQRMDLVRRAEALARMAEVAAEQQTQPTGPPSRPRVLIAYQQPWFAEAPTHCLQRQDIDVVGVVTDGAQAVGLAVAAQPDVALIDAVLSRMSGIEVLRDLQTFAAQIRTVMRVAHDNDVHAMLQAGATAAWLRTCSPSRSQPTSTSYFDRPARNAPVPNKQPQKRPPTTQPSYPSRQTAIDALGRCRRLR